MAAIGLSLLVNLLLLGFLGFYFQRIEWRMDTEPVSKSDPSTVTTITIQPVTAAPKEVSPDKPESKPFARTSPDQPASDEKTNERVGERSTRATSENPADPNAKAMPSQSGVKPKEGEIETTESQYRDGELIPSIPSTAALQQPLSIPSEPTQPSALKSTSTPAPEEVQAETSAETQPKEIESSSDSPPADSRQLEPTVSEESSLPPARASLLDGPNPTEVNVPKEVGDAERPRETPQRSTDQPDSDNADTASDRTAQSLPAPSATPRDKAFQGNQHKTAMVGSISRTGRSALNVDDSELGRYQAAISKAVELEWQRNCIRHRDFITPGFLTVRFFVEPSGRVRSVNFLGDMETGEVQKGFTLSSIREADIPKMPEELAETYEGDSLELVFRFYF